MQILHRPITSAILAHFLFTTLASATNIPTIPSTSTEPITAEPSTSTEPTAAEPSISTEPIAAEPSISTEPIAAEPSTSTEPITAEPSNSTSSITAEPSPIIEPLPACAVSPTVFDSLPYEFWIEVVFLRPIEDKFGFRPGNPVHIDRAYIPPFAGVSFDRPIVARTFQIRDLFLLKDNDLLNSDGNIALFWPDSTYTYDGYNPLVFNPIGSSYSSLNYSVVKVCTPALDTELQLRGRRPLIDEANIQFVAAEADTQVAIFVKTDSNSTDTRPVPIVLRIKQFGV